MKSTIFNELNRKLERTLIQPWLDEMNERLYHSRLSTNEAFSASYDRDTQTIALTYTDKSKHETLYIDGKFDPDRHTITFRDLRTQDDHPPSLHIVHLPENNVDASRILLQAVMRFEITKGIKRVEQPLDFGIIRDTAKTVKFTPIKP